MQTFQISLYDNASHITKQTIATIVGHHHTHFTIQAVTQNNAPCAKVKQSHAVVHTERKI
jgi:hypothetical protein